MKKILHIEAFGQGNTCEFVSTIVKAINVKGKIDCQVATSIDNNYGSQVKTHKFFGDYQKSNGVKKLLYYIVGLARIVSHCKRNKDIVAIQMHWPKVSPVDLFFIFILRWNNLKIFQTVHNNLPHEKRRYDKLFFSWIYSYSNCLIFLSNQSIIKWKELFGKLSIQRCVIPHYGYTDWLPYDRTQGFSGRIKFLFFGNIRPYKGLDVLIEAAEMLLEQSEDWELKIIGNVSYKIDDLKKRTSAAKLNDHVFWQIGWIESDDLNDSIMQSDVIVLPYKNIDSSGVLYHSMSCGRAVIGSDIGVFSERIQHEVNGLLVDKESPYDLMSKMHWCIKNRDKVSDIGINARDEMETNFSLSTISSLYIDLYQEHIIN